MKTLRIITGEKGEGKTSKIISLKSERTLGFVTLRASDCYFLSNIKSGEESLLFSVHEIGKDRIGKWYYDQNVFEKANEELLKIETGEVFLDEIGRLEVSGKGFRDSLTQLLLKDVDLTITVRKSFLNSVLESFKIEREKVTFITLSS